MLVADKNALDNVHYNSETELMPTHRKSFYGKGTLLSAGKNHDYCICKSYRTLVAMKCPNGDFVKLWNGYSNTTMTHIDSFCSTVGVPHFGKKLWDKLVVGKRYSYNELLKMR